MGMTLVNRIELLDWRRRIAELYAEVRADRDPARAWRRWCDARRRLFLEHPQSPLPAAQRTPAAAPRYFDYDPAFRVLATVTAGADEAATVPSSAGPDAGVVRAGSAHLVLAGSDITLELHWLTDYAGGLLLMCRDATSGSETYGAGRYILDTAKGADLGTEDGKLVVDLNFAYQPSCSYDPAWNCPLPPRANWLTIPIRAGERR